MTLDKKKQLEKDREKEFKKAKKLEQSFRTVSATAEGRDVFRWLLQACGFDRPSINVNPATGEVLVENTTYNEARRNLYLEARKKIPVKSLIAIEFSTEEDEDDENENEEE